MYGHPAVQMGNMFSMRKIKPLLSTDDVLGCTMAVRGRIAQLAASPGAVPMARLAAKQGDPLEKSGIVGAFCRTYDVPAAMDKFRPAYTKNVILTIKRYTSQEVPQQAARFYMMTENFCSAIMHRPCSNKLVNAFDLVRLHIVFGDLDYEAKPKRGATVSSFEQMNLLAAADKTVRNFCKRERMNKLLLILRDLRQRMRRRFGLAWAVKNKPKVNQKAP